jgi:phosphoacetylglucosamine mutase
MEAAPNADILHFLTPWQQSWEEYATTLANASTDQELVETYNKLVWDLKINEKIPARVIFARDTRASGATLVASLVDALNATGAEHTDYKLLTTPQLHYLVRCVNTKGSPYEYGEISEKGYYEKIGEAFKRAMGDKKSAGVVSVDCANGVGGPKLHELLKYIPSAAEGGIDVKVVNDDVLKPDMLNVSVCATSMAAEYFSNMQNSAVRTLSRRTSELLLALRLVPEIAAHL